MHTFEAGKHSNLSQDSKLFIEKFNLQPHPEGGYYARTYQSALTINQSCLPEKFSGERPLSTAIYYLLEQGDFSAFHRLRSDECWHFYAGGSLYLFVFQHDGGLQKIVLGGNISEDEHPQYVVEADKWFAAVPAENSAFSFVGCTVSPGFDFKDLEFAKREDLVSIYPLHRTIIEKLTR